MSLSYKTIDYRAFIILISDIVFIKSIVLLLQRRMFINSNVLHRNNIKVLIRFQINLTV